TGAINIEALQLALLAIIERHEALRTVMLEDEDGEVFGYVIQAEGNNLIQLSDLRNIESQSEKMHNLIRKEVGLSFDISCEIPLRTHLLQLTDDEYALVLTFHHHANDGVSANI
ncbi:condensation domain-containing protein, partial [Polynucleobacter yangtzensis]